MITILLRYHENTEIIQSDTENSSFENIKNIIISKNISDIKNNKIKKVFSRFKNKADCIDLINIENTKYILYDSIEIKPDDFASIYVIKHRNSSLVNDNTNKFILFLRDYALIREFNIKIKLNISPFFEFNRMIKQENKNNEEWLKEIIEKLPVNYKKSDIIAYSNLDFYLAENGMEIFRVFTS